MASRGQGSLLNLAHRYHSSIDDPEVEADGLSLGYLAPNSHFPLRISVLFEKFHIPLTLSYSQPYYELQPFAGDSKDPVSTPK